MTAQATGHQQLLKDINRMALVRLLCMRPGLSRADLANESGLTKSTISLLVRELIAEGWLQEREGVATGDLGRRPTPLFIDPSRLLLLGAGVIVGDRLLTGCRGFAGEVGHIVLQIDGPACSCGRQGCAEAVIGPRSMLREADDVADPLAEVRLRLGRGDAATGRAVQLSGRYLGVLLQNLAAAYDPECIVLGGSVVELGAAFVQPALDALHAYAQAADLEPPAVRTSCFGTDAVAVGAAALVRYSTTRPLHAVDVRGIPEPAGE